MTIAPFPPIPDDEPLSSEQTMLRRLDAATRLRAIRHRLLAGAIALTVAASGTIAAVTVANQTMQSQTAYCYSEPSVDSRYTQVASPSTVTTPDGEELTITTDDRIAAAVEKCAAVWRVGFFDSLNAPVDDWVDSDVPPLIACVRPDQVPAVFPRGPSAASDLEFCRGIGMSPGEAK